MAVVGSMTRFGESFTSAKDFIPASSSASRAETAPRSTSPKTTPLFRTISAAVSSSMLALAVQYTGSPGSTAPQKSSSVFSACLTSRVCQAAAK